MTKSHIHFWYGEESFLSSEKVRQWKKMFIEKHGDINLSDIDGKEMDASTMISEMEAIPFLGEKRLLFIKNLPPVANEKIAEKKNKQLVSCLETIPDTSIVVFTQSNPDKRLSLFKALAKHATVEVFKTLSKPELVDWITKKCADLHISFLPTAFSYFMEKTGVHLWTVYNELNKLAAYVGEKPISERDIDLLVIPNLESNIFSLLDYLSEKKRKESIQELQKIIALGEDLMMVFFMLVRQSRLLNQAKDMKSRNASDRDIASSLRIPPFAIGRLLKQSQKFEKNELERMHAKLKEIDFLLKTGGIQISTINQKELALAIERFVLDC